MSSLREVRDPRWAVPLLVLLVLLAHGVAVEHGVLALGDEGILERVRTAPSFGELVLSAADGTLRPVAWASHWLDHVLFDDGARGPHAVNVLLHAINAVLLFLWLRRATGRAVAAWTVAALFAVHPLGVQSVAWMAERAGLLAAGFALMSLDRDEAYQRTGRRSDQLLSWGAFLLSLASKPVYFLLPLVMIASDRWLAGRAPRRRLVAGGLGAIGAAATLWTMRAADALGSLREVPMVPRLENAVVGAGDTLRRLVAPLDLASSHPFRFDHPLALVIGYGVLLIAATVVAWRVRDRLPAWTFGWVTWLALQGPTFGLVQFGAQSTADRFAYLAITGILTAVVVPLVGDGWSRRRGWVVALVLILCGTTAWRAHQPWSDSIARLERDLEITGGTAPTHIALAEVYRERGDAKAALRHFTQAQLFAPQSARVMFARADLLYAMGNYADAYQLYRDGLDRDDGYGPAYAQIGRIYFAQQNYEMAGRALRRAVLLLPDDARVRVDLARLMGTLGDASAQIALYQEALALDPELEDVRAEMAWVFATTEVEGLRQPMAALRLAATEWRRSEDSSPLALEARAAALVALGRRAEAAEAMDRAESLARELGDTEAVRRIQGRREQLLADETGSPGAGSG